jgi:hypothetical protein
MNRRESRRSGAWRRGQWWRSRSRATACGGLACSRGDDENDPGRTRRVAAFIEALADLGWTDGRNVRMDLRSGGGDINRIRGLAQELVGLKPDIIVTGGTPPTSAIQRETRTIPHAAVHALVGSGPLADLRSAANIGTSANHRSLQPSLRYGSLIQREGSRLPEQRLRLADAVEKNGGQHVS